MSYLGKVVKVHNAPQAKKNRDAGESSYMHYGPYEDWANYPEDQEPVEVRKLTKVVHIIGHQSHMTKAQTRAMLHEMKRSETKSGIPVEIPETVERKR